MVKRKSLRGEEGEEAETEMKPLITSKVVEYLEPVMSRDLLCKFPDNSALGFDYSQSSLWSPLLPRKYGRDLCLDSDEACRHLEMELPEEKNNFLDFDVSVLKKRRRRKTKNAMIDSLKFSCFFISTKGWKGMMKAASKHLKKTKKKNSVGDVKLLNYFRC